MDIAGRSDIYAHRGMVNTAIFLHDKIKELRLLEEAKSRHPVNAHSGHLKHSTEIMATRVLFHVGSL